MDISMRNEGPHLKEESGITHELPGFIYISNDGLTCLNVVLIEFAGPVCAPGDHWIGEQVFIVYNSRVNDVSRIIRAGSALLSNHPKLIDTRWGTFDWSWFPISLIRSKDCRVIENARLKLVIFVFVREFRIIHTVKWQFPWLLQYSLCYVMRMLIWKINLARKLVVKCK